MLSVLDPAQFVRPCVLEHLSERYALKGAEKCHEDVFCHLF